MVEAHPINPAAASRHAASAHVRIEILELCPVDLVPLQICCFIVDAVLVSVMSLWELQTCSRKKLLSELTGAFGSTAGQTPGLLMALPFRNSASAKRVRQSSKILRYRSPVHRRQTPAPISLDPPRHVHARAAIEAEHVLHREERDVRWRGHDRTNGGRVKRCRIAT